MPRLTVTAKSQITLRKDLLQHLGVKPGGKLDITPMPDGRAEIRAARPQGSIDDFIGLLAGKTKRVLTIEEMNEIALTCRLEAVAGTSPPFFLSRYRWGAAMTKPK